MANETKIPDALLVQTNLSGAVTAIDEDPDAPGADWLTAASNNADSVCVVSFPTPTGSPTTGSGLQDFKWWARLTPNATACTYNVYLRESGTRLNGGAAIATGSLTSASGQLITATWDAALLGTADGSVVEAELVVTKSGGAPGARTTGEVGAVEWNVTYSTGATVLGVAVLAASAVTSSIGALILSAAVALSGSGSVAAAGLLTHGAAATVSGSATVAAAGTVAGTQLGVAALTASATTAATGSVATTHLADAALTADVILSASGSFQTNDLLGEALIECTATLRPESRVNPDKIFYHSSSFTVATLPAASNSRAGSIVYVSDAPAGQRFKGNYGGTWENLG